VVQATETVKLILGAGEPLVGRLMLYDALSMRFRELKLRRNPECPVCGDNPTIKELIDYHQFCGVPQDGSEAAATTNWELDPTEVKERLDNGNRIVLLDVREPHELQICQLPAFKSIPLGQLPSRIHELNTADEIVAVCKVGMRSARAVQFLRQAGFTKVKNMRGGTNLWAEKVDPSMPRY
jgi:adenylyltransferase/sulfurtransferase